MHDDSQKSGPTVEDLFSSFRKDKSAANIMKYGQNIIFLYHIIVLFNKLLPVIVDRYKDGRLPSFNNVLPAISPKRKQFFSKCNEQIVARSPKTTSFFPRMCNHLFL